MRRLRMTRSHWAGGMAGDPSAKIAPFRVAEHGPIDGESTSC